MKSSKLFVTLSVVCAGFLHTAGSSQAAPVTLDTTFGNQGILTTSAGSGLDGRAMVIAPDGKITVAGNLTSSNGNLSPVIIRYTGIGSARDVTFDGDGIRGFLLGNSPSVNGLALQADGKLVVVGRSNNNFFVVRLNSDGSFDTSFSGDGRLETNFGGDDTANAVAIQGDGKIVVVGGTTNKGAETPTFSIARYLSNGDLDTSFDGNGVRAVTFANEAAAKSVGIQNDGKIVVAGDSNGVFAVARLASSGALDGSFSGDGRDTVALSSSDRANAVGIQQNGKIVVVGTGTAGSLGGGLGGSRNPVVAIIRYNTNGTLDTTFSGDGKVLDYGGTATSFVFQGSSIIIGGYNNPSNGSLTDFSVSRYTESGDLDTSFNDSGIVTTNLSNIDRGNAIAIQSDGKIVIAGFASFDFGLVRYNAPFGSISSASTPSAQNF